MKRKTIRKLQIAFLTALIFIIVPIMKPDDQAKAAEGDAITVEDLAVEELTTEWWVMVERLERAIQNGTGQNVNFMVGKHISISADILSRLTGKNATLALHVDNGVVFTIGGGEIYNPNAEFTMDVSFESVIPEEVKAQIASGSIYRQFSMERKEDYPCGMNVHVGLGEESAGRDALLYSYDETVGIMRPEGSFRINDQGQAMFPLRRGDEYVVSVYGSYTVMPGDNLSHIAARNGIRLQTLIAINPQIKDPDLIQIGQMIHLPN